MFYDTGLLTSIGDVPVISYVIPVLLLVKYLNKLLKYKYIQISENYKKYEKY